MNFSASNASAGHFRGSVTFSARPGQRVTRQRIHQPGAVLAAKLREVGLAQSDLSQKLRSQPLRQMATQQRQR
jgi:hypothetical protein